METEEKAIKRRSYINGLLTGFFIGATIIAVCFCFMSVRTYKQYKESLKTVSSALEASQKGQLTGELIDKTTVSKIETLYKLIDEEFYFHDDVDKEKMRNNMYKGIINSLGDIYSEYYTVEEYNELLESVEGKYYGIGSHVTVDKEVNLVVLCGVFENSGASDAGLRDGDYVYAVNDEVVAGWELDDVVAIVRGDEGTTVKLTILRDNEYFDVDVMRKEVVSETVVSEMKEDGIGYLQIREFDMVTTAQFEEKFEELKKQGMKGMILDLRSNPGGNLETILAIARDLLPEGLITYIEYRDGNREEYFCDGTKEIDIPLVVLVNGYSASASELLTGAIKDYGVGTIMGTTTFGKGIVQDFKSFNDGTGIKFTSSSYFTPKGVCIHKTGIEPDIVVEFEPDPYYESGIDNQLNAAIDYIKGKLSNEQ